MVPLSIMVPLSNLVPARSWYDCVCNFANVSWLNNLTSEKTIADSEHKEISSEKTTADSEHHVVSNWENQCTLQWAPSSALWDNHCTLQWIQSIEQWAPRSEHWETIAPYVRWAPRSVLWEHHCTLQRAPSSEQWEYHCFLKWDEKVKNEKNPCNLLWATNSEKWIITAPYGKQWEISMEKVTL